MRSVVMGLCAAVTALGVADESPRGRYEALVKEFDTAQDVALEAVAKATSDQERLTASLRRPQTDEYAPRFFALAEEAPGDPVALDALIWVTTRCVFGAQAEKALGLIARDHGRSGRIKDFCGQCSRYGEPFPAYEAMLRAILGETPHPEVRGAATLALADYLKMAKETTESRLVKLSIAGGLPLGKDQVKNVQAMKDRGLDAVAAEAATLYQAVIDGYPGLRIESNLPQEAAELAKGQLFVLRNLGIGRVAPEIVGEDIRGRAMRLGDYRGKVVVLDFGSHRSCGVCRAMYPHLRSMVEKYKDEPFALLGISVDDDVNELVSIAAKGETTWPIWWDGAGSDGPLATQWVIRSMPTFFVLDRRGVIRNKGFLRPGEIGATVDMLLKESPPPGR